MTGRHRLCLAVLLCSAPFVSPYGLERPESSSAAQNYLLFCGGCHGVDGGGAPRKVPPLRGAMGRLLGVEGGRDYLMRVPGVSRSALSDARLAEVLNWCVAAFAKDNAPAGVMPFTAAELAAARHRPLLSVQSTRAALLSRTDADPAAAKDEY